MSILLGQPRRSGEGSARQAEVTMRLGEGNPSRNPPAKSLIAAVPPVRVLHRAAAGHTRISSFFYSLLVIFIPCF
jgi:hypothetical protein